MNVEIGTERPRYSFSGNICFQFSAFFLCSAGWRASTTNLCRSQLYPPGQRLWICLLYIRVAFSASWQIIVIGLLAAALWKRDVQLTLLGHLNPNWCGGRSKRTCSLWKAYNKCKHGNIWKNLYLFQNVLRAEQEGQREIWAIYVTEVDCPPPPPVLDLPRVIVHYDRTLGRGEMSGPKSNWTCSVLPHLHSLSNWFLAMLKGAHWVWSICN